MPSNVPVEFGTIRKKRGDVIEINVNDVLDAAGSAVPLADYSLTAVLKYKTDTATNDSSAISVITAGSGIVVSSTNDAALTFPASATEAITGPCIIDWELQAIKTATPTIHRRTLAYGDIEIIMDRVRATS